ncbi:DUF6338 family protein [Kocuria sp. UBA5001]|uniref:DUF6338 family protein n=1 Tax=Kocuria sp. UBA5001 TaxID=1946674 RepID=UPI0025C3C5D3|nr:DUF6338 family protein [Kocuria sp. UBA5001]
MTPSSLATLFGFLFFIAPGLLADLLEARRRAGAKESAFREIGRVGLFSLACSVAGAAVVGVVLVGLQGWTGFNPLRAVRDSAYATDYFWWSVTAVGLVSVVGCLAALGFQYWRLGPMRLQVQQISAWSVAFEIPGRLQTRPIRWFKGKLDGTAAGRFMARFHPGPGAGRVVKVEMLSGEQYVGVLATFTPNLEMADRELALAQPLWVERDLSKGLTRVPQEWERIVLRGDQIKVIAVQKYVSPSTSV